MFRKIKNVFLTKKATGVMFSSFSCDRVRNINGQNWWFVRCESAVQQYAVKIIRLWPVNVAFWSSPIQPAFTTGLWKGTIHEFTAITTHIINMPIVVSATRHSRWGSRDGQTKSPSRTLMMIVFISNRSLIIWIWKCHTVGLNVLYCGIRVALWLVRDPVLT